MEPRPWCGNDVAVGLGLRQLDGLLFLQHQEAVKLGRSLFLVVVSAQLEQADGLGSSFSHHALSKQKKMSKCILNVFIVNEYAPNTNLKTVKHLLSSLVPPSLLLVLVSSLSVLTLLIKTLNNYQ